MGSGLRQSSALAFTCLLAGASLLFGCEPAFLANRPIDPDHAAQLRQPVHRSADRVFFDPSPPPTADASGAAVAAVDDG
jgi:hypothetical protein